MEAHMIPSKKRFFWRTAFHAPARLSTPDGDQSVQLVDISLKGVLLHTQPHWHAAKGTKVQLFVSLAADAQMSMWCTAAHVDGVRLGLRCDNIDLDSITHLRRLVELNVGDHHILERDLACLIQDNQTQADGSR
jgi:hypothetical protein